MQREIAFVTSCFYPRTLPKVFLAFMMGAKLKMIELLPLNEYRISSVIRWSFFFPKHSQNLDLSYKIDLDLCDCLGRAKFVI